jgi:hypothetical protein
LPPLLARADTGVPRRTTGGRVSAGRTSKPVMEATCAVTMTDAGHATPAEGARAVLDADRFPSPVQERPR